MMHTVRTIQLHARESSTGAETISALYKVLLSSWWIAGRTNSNSVLFALIGSLWPGIWFLLIVGIVHLGALARPAVRRSGPVFVRKACSVVGFLVWSSVIYDVTQGDTISLLLLLIPIALGLVYAIVRETYAVV